MIKSSSIKIQKETKAFLTKRIINLFFLANFKVKFQPYFMIDLKN